jgi:hypothetical protein
MPISALVITLRRTISAGDVFDRDVADRDAALAVLAGEPCIELGKPEGLRVPAVSETPTLDEGRRLVERLLSMDEVAHVDVLSVNFEDSEPWNEDHF